MSTVQRRSAATNGWDRVSGGAGYVADVRVPGALHVAFAYSSVSHARIIGIDLEPALSAPGVVDAVSGREIGEVLLGRRLEDYPALAGERVLFVGQRVAAVAAVNREAARAAAAMIEVDYEPLPAILELSQAMNLDDDPLHPRYKDYTGAVSDRPGPNIQGFWESITGDADEAFDAAEHVFDHTFRGDRSHAASIEPHACIVSAGRDRIDVWATNKSPYQLRAAIAAVANRPVEDVRVHLAPIGGDFGGKGFPYAEVVCYALSARTGRPVRHTMSYYEELTTTASRHPLTMRLRTAVSGGLITGLYSETLLDGGAFGGLKPIPGVIVPADAPFGSYALDNRNERCVSYYTNTLPGSHVRSPGEFQTLFAAESQVDIIAAELGTDPIEFRLANAADQRVRRVLEELRAVVRQWRSSGPPGAGVGVALCWRDVGAGQSTVRCTATEDGVEIQLSAVDQGAGSYVVFGRIAAEELALPFDTIRIQPVTVGADPRLRDAGAGASRGAGVAGKAVAHACRALLDEIGGPPDRPDADWLARRLRTLGRPRVEVEGSAALGREAPPGLEVRSHAGVAIELSVDRDTGQLTLHRALMVVDAGRVLDPVGHRGQLEGGFIFGLSQTLLEQLSVQDGQVVTANLGDYRLATSADVPPLDIRVLEPDAQVGDAVLSIAELGNIGVAPAVANAVADAARARVFELPLTSERILAALRAK
jgi:CO/xanthine dehydrogenase Mo-binding subunit